MKSLTLAFAATLLIAGAAQAAPANAPRPTDLTSAPPSTNAPVNAPRPTNLTNPPPSTDAPVNAPRPTDLTDKPAPHLLPAIQTVRCHPRAQDDTAEDTSSRAGAGVLKSDDAASSRPHH
jgi:hypothetical protein